MFALENGIVVNQKNTELTTINNNSTFGYIFKRTERRFSKRYMHIHVHSCITVAQKQEKATCPSMNDMH